MAGRSAEAIAIVAVGVTLPAVLVPLMLALNSGVRSEVTDVRSDLADVRRDLHTLGERVARIEGRLDALAPVMTPMRPAAPAEPAPAPAA